MFPHTRTYANACFRLEVHAALPCFHDWIGWYLDVSGAQGGPVADLEVTYRIHSRPGEWSGVPSLSHAFVDHRRREITSWPSAEAGERVPMSDGLNFFTRPLVCLLEREGLHALHAAHLRRGQRSVLVAGPGRSGKSSLAVLLSLQGWELLSDDLTFVRAAAQGYELRPFPTRVKFRNRGVAELVRERPVPADPTGLVSADPLLVVLPRFVAHEVARLEPLGAQEATHLLLADNLVLEISDAEDNADARKRRFDFLCQVGRRARFFRLGYGDRDLDRVPELIERAAAGA